MIDEKNWYSLKQIHTEKLLPMLKSEYLIKRWIKAGAIKSVVVGDDKGKRYSVKGAWIIKFLAKWESEDFRG